MSDTNNSIEYNNSIKSNTNETISNIDNNTNETANNIDNTLLDNVLSNMLNNMDPNMMSDITKLAGNIFSNQETSNTEEHSNDDEEEEVDLDLYLLDEEGNNICDHLHSINTNITKLNDNIEKLTNFYIKSQSKSSNNIDS